MAESMRITNFPDAGSPERVAYDLYIQLRQLLPGDKAPADRIQASLDLFAQCRNATYGLSSDAKKITGFGQG